MIHEYALDPSVLTFWASNDRDYAEFFREYGLGSPRIVSSFPKKKVSKLRSYLLQHSPEDSQSLTSQRYTEMVTKLLESIVLRDVSENKPANWSDAAVAENERVPFDVILSSMPINVGQNVTPENMYSQGSVWNHPDQIDIQRTNAGLLSVVSHLTRLSTQKIVIVDPYGWTSEAIGFVCYLINSLRDGRLADAVPSLTLFYKEKRGGGKSGKGSPGADHVKNLILQGIEGGLTKIDLQVVELRESTEGDVFHNRCILTEHGGVITGHGIGVSGVEAHTDQVILMRSDIYLKKWNQFVDECCFEEISKA